MTRLFTSTWALLALLCLTTSCGTYERVADLCKYRGQYHVRTVKTDRLAARPATAKVAPLVATDIKPEADPIPTPAVAPVEVAEPAVVAATAAQAAPAPQKATRAHKRAHAKGNGLATAQASPKVRMSAARVALTYLTAKKMGGHKADALPLSVLAAQAGSNQIVATVLCFFLGVLGIHRFYLGYIWQGVVQLLTFGGFGIWWLIDLIRIIIGDLQPNGGSYTETF